MIKTWRTHAVCARTGAHVDVQAIYDTDAPDGVRLKAFGVDGDMVLILNADQLKLLIGGLSNGLKMVQIATGELTLP